MKENILYALAAINLLAFILFGVDKVRAKRRLWRIPERVLIGTAVLGGSVGAILGMMVFHHKTKHAKFRCGLPLILLVQLLLIFLLKNSL